MFRVISIILLSFKFTANKVNILVKSNQNNKQFFNTQNIALGSSLTVFMKITSTPFGSFTLFFDR